ncbi:MAG: TetR/AcrR family transcriptional regulator [Microthrixaceae bacterium]
MEPQQERSRATRLGLLVAAVECLAESGWSNTTVTVVADRAGVSRGAAQHHFRTREDLFIAAVEYVAETRAAEVREFATRVGPDPLETRAVVDIIVDFYTGTLFRAALELWVASSAEPQLREKVVPLEARIGRDVHRLTVQLLGADESLPGVRESIQATLDLARGLGLSNLLTDDRRRREPILAQWAIQLQATIRPPGTAGSSD